MSDGVAFLVWGPEGDGILLFSVAAHDLPDELVVRSWRVLKETLIVTEVVLGVVVGSEFVAPADKQSTNAEVCMLSLSTAGLVVESLARQYWSLDASDHSLPLMWLSNLTCPDSLVNASSTKESAASAVGPHVDGGSAALANSASWKSPGCE